MRLQRSYEMAAAPADADDAYGFVADDRSERSLG